MPMNQGKDPSETTYSVKEEAVELIGFKESAMEMIGFLGTMAGYAFGLFVVVFLAFQAPDLYNDSLERYDTALLPILEQGAFAEMGEFIRRIGLDASDPEAIPMRIGTPWVWFLALVAACVYVIPVQCAAFGRRVFGMTDSSVEPASAE